MKKHVYRVTVNSAYTANVAADTATEAKRVALEHVTVERLSAGEVVDLVQRGIAIQGAPVANAEPQA